MISIIRVKCPQQQCGTVLAVPARLGGRRVQCSCCGAVFRVPARPGLRMNPNSTPFEGLKSRFRDTA